MDKVTTQGTLPPIPLPKTMKGLHVILRTWPFRWPFLSWPVTTWEVWSPFLPRPPSWRFCCRLSSVAKPVRDLKDFASALLVPGMFSLLVTRGALFPTARVSAPAPAKEFCFHRPLTHRAPLIPLHVFKSLISAWNRIMHFLSHLLSVSPTRMYIPSMQGPFLNCHCHVPSTSDRVWLPEGLRTHPLRGWAPTWTRGLIPQSVWQTVLFSLLVYVTV